MGVHESQSLLWERMVGLSKPFAAYLLPIIREYFPQVGSPQPAAPPAGWGVAAAEAARAAQGRRAAAATPPVWVSVRMARRTPRLVSMPANETSGHLCGTVKHPC